MMGASIHVLRGAEAEVPAAMATSDGAVAVAVVTIRASSDKCSNRGGWSGTSSINNNNNGRSNSGGSSTARGDNRDRHAQNCRQN